MYHNIFIAGLRVTYDEKLIVRAIYKIAEILKRKGYAICLAGNPLTDEKDYQNSTMFSFTRHGNIILQKGHHNITIWDTNEDLQLPDFVEINPEIRVLVINALTKKWKNECVKDADFIIFTNVEKVDPDNIDVFEKKILQIKPNAKIIYAATRKGDLIVIGDKEVDFYKMLSVFPNKPTTTEYSD